MTKINFNSDRDIRLVPFSPLTESDDLEIRVQVNSEDKGRSIISIYIDKQDDDNLIHAQDISTGVGYSLIKCRHKMHGLVGHHKLIITADNSVIGEKHFDVVSASNRVD